MKRVLPIVEGTGDATAVPTLIRRIAHEHEIFDLEILTPHQRGDIPTIKPRLRDFLVAASFDEAPLFWVLDYDCDGCTDVALDLQKFEALAKQIVPHIAVRFALMVKEFETLFLVDETTTRRVLKHIPGDTIFPQNAESVRDAKGWLSKALPKGLSYKPTTHQERISAQVDLTLLRQQSPSYQRFEQALLDLIS